MSLDERTGTVEGAIRETAVDVTNIWKGLNELRREVDQFRAEMTQFRAETNDRFNRVDAKLDGLIDAVADINKRLG